MACRLIVLPLIYRLAFIAVTDPSWDSGVRKIVLLRLDAIGVGVLVAGLCEQGVFAERRVRNLSAALGAVLLIMSVLAYWAHAAADELHSSSPAGDCEACTLSGRWSCSLWAHGRSQPQATLAVERPFMRLARRLDAGEPQRQPGSRQ